MGSRVSSSAYWCHQCNRFIRLPQRENISCPTCNGGFIEEIEEGPRAQLLEAFSFDENNERPSAVQIIEAMTNLLGQLTDRRRDVDVHGRHGQGSFRPVVIVRGGQVPRDNNGGHGGGGMEFIFDTGSGVGIRGLPANIGDYFVGSDFDRLIEQLTQNDRCGPPPAPRSAIDAMPTIRVTREHLRSNSNCSICTEPFELNGIAREMPCKHIYHSDCILPWLTQHNSCPVCRNPLPGEGSVDGGQPRSRPRGASPAATTATTSSVPISSQGGRANNTNNSSTTQGRRSLFNISSWWPFRSSNSNPHSQGGSTE